MIKKLLFLPVILISTYSFSQWSQFGGRLVAEGGNLGESVSLSADGKILAIGAPKENNNEGATRVYTLSDSGWVQMGNKLIGSGSIGGARQGHSVSLSADGKTLASGGYYDNQGIGATWIYTLSENNWIQVGNKLVGSGAIFGNNGWAHQGNSISLSGDGKTLAVGGQTDNGVMGATWVFTLSGSNWVQMGNKLVGSGATIGTIGVLQGTSVSLSADGMTLAVGGYEDNNYLGAVWVFALSGKQWVQMGNKLVGSGTVGNVGQGVSVSLSSDGKTLAVGGFYDNSELGATWIYTLSGNNWIQMGNKLIGSGAVGFSYQGTSVSLSSDGKILAVGASEDNNQKGATWIFTKSDSGWVQVGDKLVGYPYTGQNISQGCSIDLSDDGKTLAVGGRFDNRGLGATWLFRNSIVSGLENTELTGQKESILVYPNPFNQILTVHTSEEEQYVLYDLNGNAVENGTTNSTIIGNQLNTGIYKLKVNNHVYKVVKIPY